VCVSERVREGERERDRGRGKEREREREVERERQRCPRTFTALMFNAASGMMFCVH